ncbi:MAG: DUF4040 domain-containing protein [Desulfuromonadaceae bacterium]|nr:DUF4040 domain-containing protein [Desulfuromonadaceae bacterium]
MELFIDITLLTFLCITAMAITVIRKLFCAVMLASIFSLLCACLFVTMDAVDVAFTEAAVGSGISTVLMLAALNLTHSREKRPPHQPLVALLVVGVTGIVLMYGTMDLPVFGDAAAPIHHHVAPRYIEQSPLEVGPPNFVTSILASYRGYDTLAETIVIFTAGLSVIALLGIRDRYAGRPIPSDRSAMKDYVVLRIVAKMLMPFVFLFALYVQFHGDYGAGGGFQAGVIFASGVIIHSLTLGRDRTLKAFPHQFLRGLATVGVLIYGGTGLASILRGGNFLDYSVLAATQLKGQHLGIFLVELGVGLTVFSIMILMYYAFSYRREP